MSVLVVWWTSEREDVNSSPIHYDISDLSLHSWTALSFITTIYLLSNLNYFISLNFFTGWIGFPLSSLALVVVYNQWWLADWVGLYASTQYRSFCLFLWIFYFSVTKFLWTNSPKRKCWKLNIFSKIFGWIKHFLLSHITFLCSIKVISPMNILVDKNSTHCEDNITIKRLPRSKRWCTKSLKVIQLIKNYEFFVTMRNLWRHFFFYCSLFIRFRSHSLKDLQNVEYL